MNGKQFFLFAALCLTLLLPGISSRAQAISGDLVGTVTDASGATVPGALVTVTNQATNTKSSTKANDKGEYRLSNLLPGAYTLTAEAPGFSVSTVKNVPVSLNTTATANLMLEVGSASTSVEVVEAAAVLDTTTAQIQNTYSAQQARDLPNTGVGVGVINLSLLQAGVTSSGGVGVGTGPSVGGQRPRNNNFTVEGVDNNSKAVTGPSVFIPNDSVAEFTLLENQFRAEYGHSSGGQFNTILKSGSNTFHGELYDYLQNRNLNALDQVFANQGVFSNPRFDLNRLGANLGGPILKNKLFFFSSFEYDPLGQSSTVGSPVYAPTADGYATLGSVPGVSQTNLNILKTYAMASTTTPGAPTVTVNGVSVPTGIIPVVAPNFTNSYFGVLTADYNISEKDQLRGRYLYGRADAIDTVATLPAFYTTVPTRGYIATLAEYHTFSPTVTNEFRFGFQRLHSENPVGNQTFPGLSAFPNLQFNNLGLQVGPNPSFPQYTISNLYQYIDALTWVCGNHTFKFGAEFRNYIAPQFFSQRVRGDYQYVNLSTYLLDITPDFLAQRNVGSATYYGNQTAVYGFAQDTWRVTSHLTLDLGARYEYTTVPLGMRQQQLNAGASAPPLLSIGAPSADPYGIAPRLGVAYTPDRSGNTVLRAGFGLAYDVIFDNIGTNTVPPQFAVTVDVLQSAAGQANFLKNGGITAANVASGTSTTALRAKTSSVVPNQVLPYSINWNFGIQHILARNYTLEARYVGTKGVHLIMQQQINRVSPVTATNNIPTFLSAPSLSTLGALPLTVGQLRSTGSIDPVYGNLGFINTVTSYQPRGYSQYHGLALQLNRRFSNGLQFQTAYTWSHNIDNSTAEVASTYLTPRRAQNFNDLAAEKASSALDRRHRLTISALYDLPFFKSRNNWALKNLVGNWEFAPIYTYESPEYFTVQSGIDSNLNSDAAPDRTILNGSGIAGTGSDVVGLDRSGRQIPLTASTAARDAIVAYVALNPNARYIRAGYGAYANAGRNTEPTRPINNVDLSLMKRFSFTERFRLELTMQALNVLNHAQFTPGSINDAGFVSTFNPGVQSYVTAGNPLFNNPERAFSSNPRTVQIACKLFF